MSSLFEEYEYNPEQDDLEQDDAPSFEVGLDTLLEALNVFGSGGGNFPALSEKSNRRGWKDRKDDNDENNNDRGSTRPEPAKNLWLRGGERITHVKITYGGRGDTLKLILWVNSCISLHNDSFGTFLAQRMRTGRKLQSS